MGPEPAADRHGDERFTTRCDDPRTDLLRRPTRQDPTHGQHLQLVQPSGGAEEPLPMTLWRHLRLVRSCALPAKTRLYLHDYPRGVHVVGTLEMQPDLENRGRVVLRNDMFHPES